MPSAGGPTSHKSAFFVALVLGSLFCTPTHAARFDTRSPLHLLRDCGMKLERFARKMTWKKLAREYGDAALTEILMQSHREKPVRDIRGNPLFRDFIDEGHRIYVSITTKPSRAKYLPQIIGQLDLTHIEKVFVALPLIYAHTGARYVVPEKLKGNPKVEILVPTVDLGPATKLIPAVERVRAKDPKSRIITIDDDIAYPRPVINELILASLYEPEAVIGVVGTYLSYFIKEARGFPTSAQKAGPHRDIIYQQEDIIEGYGSIIYQAGMVDTERLRWWLDDGPEAFVSDDLLINLGLEAVGIPRFSIQSNYVRRNDIIQLPYGFYEDALHLGEGLDYDTEGKIDHIKYDKVLRRLAPQFHPQMSATP